MGKKLSNPLPPKGAVKPPAPPRANRDGNIEWLRDRASAIRAGNRPKTEKEWQAVAKGLDMIGDAMQQIYDVIGEVSH